MCSHNGLCLILSMPFCLQWPSCLSSYSVLPTNFSQTPRGTVSCKLNFGSGVLLANIVNVCSDLAGRKRYIGYSDFICTHFTLVLLLYGAG